MKTDTTVFELIEKEHQRQLKGIELIASENFVSDEVMKAMGSWLTNKYAEGYPGKRYYGGCQVVDEVESLAIERVCKLFGAEYANVQPHSGAQANAAVFLACLKPGDTFMGLNLDHGGHLSHGSAVNTSGILYHAIGYNLNKETGRVDYDEMEKLALEHRPKMIIGGGSAYSREWDYARMREIADKVGAIFMVDMAHPAGLIAAGLLENPVKYAHIVTSTTHKTLRGPRGGIILMGKDFDNPWGLKTPKGEVKKMSQLLNSAVFPGIQGGPLEHVIAQQISRPDGQGGRESLGGCRHYGEQEHGAVRQSQCVSNFRHPLRYAGHYDTWSERRFDGTGSRVDRKGLECAGRRKCHCRRAQAGERGDGRLSFVCLLKNTNRRE